MRQARPDGKRVRNPARAREEEARSGAGGAGIKKKTVVPEWLPPEKRKEGGNKVEALERKVGFKSKDSKNKKA